MKKIRTGNDIKVIFTIKGPASTDTVNMKQLRVYFVNNSSETHCCVKRFPKEPFPQFYEPTKYTVHGCGKFEYNVNPSYNKCEYAVCMGNFHDYHIWPNYNGFGINPKKFNDCCHCCCEHECKEYMAPFTIEKEQNQIAAYFPACQQKCGIYKMIVIMTTYEDGWGKKNLHTYTIDYGTIFELSEDSDSDSGNIIINLGETQDTSNPCIGFQAVEEVQDVDTSLLDSRTILIGEHSITNTTGDWAYLWIFSNTEINSLTIAGQEQPMKQFTRPDYKYCYRSYQKLDQTTFKFTIS